MEKVVIIGSPGAGKTTLARELGNILDIEVIHLDRHFWNSNWHEIPRSERVKIQAELIQKQKWIIEGTYLDSSDGRLQAADTIIFLDMPRWLCLWQVLKRRFQDQHEPRPDLPEGCKEKIRLRYLAKVLIFPVRGRILFHQKIERLQRQKEIHYHQFTSHCEVDAFLASVRTETLKQVQSAHVEERELVFVTV